MTTHIKPKVSTYNLDIQLMLKHMQVPFVPTLGCVHFDCLEIAIADVLEVSNTNNFLPYDKDSRWYEEKKETILSEYIYQDDKQTIIPTILKGTNSLIKYYYYTVNDCDDHFLQSLKSKLSVLFPNANAQVLSFGRDESLKYDTVIFLIELADITITKPIEISRLSDLPSSIISTLPDLAKDNENSGFAFVYDRLQNGYDDGDILVSICDGEITGAVGALKPIKDAVGKTTRFPPFFGVNITYRRSGVGTSLWNAALSWAVDARCEYIILQAQYNSPAEHFYKKMGLKPLGGVIRS